MDIDFESIGRNILSGVREQMGALWDDLSESDRAMIEACAMDAGTLAVASAAASSPAERDAVRREQNQISAQLANLKAVAAGKVPKLAEDFWTVAGNVLVGALGMAVKLAPLAL